MPAFILQRTDIVMVGDQYLAASASGFSGMLEIQAQDSCIENQSPKVTFFKKKKKLLWAVGALIKLLVILSCYF